MDKKRNRIFFIVFTLCSLIFAIVPTILTAPSSEMVKVDATIEKIERYGDFDNYNYDVTISYEFNEQPYEVVVNFYTSSYKEGKVITVYVDPFNPTEVRDGVGFYFCIIVGGLFASFGLTFLAIDLLNEKKKKDLLGKGTMISGKVVDCIKLSIQINHKYCYRIICENNGEEYKSEILYFNPSTLIRDNNIEYLNIYVDPMRPKRYYIDISSVE